MLKIALGALVLALAVPVGSADPLNEAPVAVPVATPMEARWGEPIEFRDASWDADGSIVRSKWTFSDGRSVEGAVVTKVLAYAGTHETRLDVWDDLGAHDVAFLYVVVRAPLHEGRATALAVGDAALADTGAVRTEAHATWRASAGEVRNGDLRAAGLDAEVFTLDSRTVATATAEYVKIPVPIGYILLTGVESHALIRCAGEMRTARFTQLRLNDSPLIPPGEVAPNTRIELPGGGVLTLNAQDAAGHVLSVTAMRLEVPGSPTVEVARAAGGVSWCLY